MADIALSNYIVTKEICYIWRTVCCEMYMICDIVCDPNVCVMAKFPVQYIYYVVIDTDIWSWQLEINN